MNPISSHSAPRPILYALTSQRDLQELLTHRLRQKIQLKQITQSPPYPKKYYDNHDTLNLIKTTIMVIFSIITSDQVLPITTN